MKAKNNLPKILSALAVLTSRKIPFSLFIALALIGAFVFGAAVAIATGFDTKLPKPTEVQQTEIQNKNYVELIQGYETLTDMYNTQGENIATILSKDSYQNNPQAVFDALDQVDKTRDLILVQLGKIQQLRKAAGFPEANLQKPN